MTDEIYRLYVETLPEIVRSEKVVKAIFSVPDNHIIYRKIDGRLAGVSVIGGNTIYLLCVDKSHQNKCIGNELLMQSEEHIASAGFKKVVLGAGKTYIVPGVPMNRDAHHFFIKRGYTHSWGDMRCIDMERELSDFHYNAHSVGDTINEVTYRWATIDDLDGILVCLSDNEEDFTKYYQNKNYYKSGSKERVIIAEKDNEVMGALAILIESARPGMGSLALTATARKHRNRGIATTLVTLAMKYLKDIGMERAHGGYTYSDLISMYERAGLGVCMEYFMGEKII